MLQLWRFSFGAGDSTTQPNRRIHIALENPTTILPKWKEQNSPRDWQMPGRLPGGGGRTGFWRDGVVGRRIGRVTTNSQGDQRAKSRAQQHTHMCHSWSEGLSEAVEAKAGWWGEVRLDPAGMKSPKSPPKTFCSVFSKDPIFSRPALLSTPHLLTNNPCVFPQYNQCWLS